MMENMIEQLKLLMKHHGCEEMEGEKSEKVDTAEINPSAGSKRLDYQHYQEPTNTEKGLH